MNFQTIFDLVDSYPIIWVGIVWLIISTVLTYSIAVKECDSFIDKLNPAGVVILIVLCSPIILIGLAIAFALIVGIVLPVLIVIVVIMILGNFIRSLLVKKCHRISISQLLDIFI